MTEIVFTAAEYQHDQSILHIPYRYVGSVNSGWSIQRDGQDWLQLGPGFVPVKSLYCGICSTDLVRHQLPFPLPQITGHEMVGEFDEHPVAVEINASHLARGVAAPHCSYCQSGLDIHCPDRMTLGIDRLPGGFAPWVLAPVHALHRLPSSVSPQAGVLIEPFAAAVKAVMLSPPLAGDRVAVLGPRRLGMLMIAALASQRQLAATDFSITAVMRHAELAPISKRLGADEIVVIDAAMAESLDSQFDIVFDTTGSPEGFATAIQMARRQVHLKSTHGSEVMGMQHLTSMVINEQQVLGLCDENINALVESSTEQPTKQLAYVSPALVGTACLDAISQRYKMVSTLKEVAPFNPGQGVELAVIDSLAELNSLTKPLTDQGQARLKAGGRILISDKFERQSDAALWKKIRQDHLMLATSRCGSFAHALAFLEKLPELATQLQASLLTHTLDVGELAQAMDLARQSAKSIKVVVKIS